MNWQWHSVRWCKSGTSGWCWHTWLILQVFQNFPIFRFYIKKVCEVKSHSTTFDNFPWLCWKHISGLSPYSGQLRFCFWSESSLICSWYQVCARYTSGGTLLILCISEADQTEIREPASFVGRNKHFQKNYIFHLFDFFFFFLWCLVFSVVFWSSLCSTAKKVGVSDFLGFMKTFVLALVWMSSYSGILHWGLGFKPQISKQFCAKMIEL